MDLEEIQTIKKPSWLKVKFPSEPNFFHVSSILKKEKLHTICQSAKCPNISECWSKKTATFLILGDVCTRECAFCAVKKGLPSGLFPEESHQVAHAAALLGLRYAVITSVTRDDLPDGGAGHFREVIRTCRCQIPELEFELLVPDFRDCQDQALDILTDTRPFVFGHNVETVPSLYSKARPGGDYQRSLTLLKKVKQRWPNTQTKSALMLGLGETVAEITKTMDDLRARQVDILTLGQYLQPTKNHLPVVEYIKPEQFSALRDIGLAKGFFEVAAGPLVRSSYRADRVFKRNNLDL